jgi:hypothetical protein
MNCPKCGCILPAGAAVCPVCGSTPSQGVQRNMGNPPQNGGYTPNAYGQGSVGPTVYPQAGYGPTAYPSNGYDPNNAGAGQGYAQNYEGYPQGYRQVYGRYDAPGRERNDFFTAMGNLPHVIHDLFLDPGETLHGMMDRNDRYTGAVVAGMSLLLTFLAAILFARGAIASVYSGLAGLMGTQLTGDAASLNQGINYIVGKMAAPVGGIAALCQLFALITPVAAALVYLCGFKKVRFSFLLASNLVAILTLPSLAASLLCMLLCLVSPWLGGMALLAGATASYVLLGALLSWITGLSQPDLVKTKIAVICAAEIVKILFFWLVGGALAASALVTAQSLVNTLGSLI